MPLKKFFYFFLLKVLNFFLNISINLYLSKNKKKFDKFYLCALDVNTVGDSILYLDFLRLKTSKNNYLSLLILPNLQIQKTLANLFLKKKQYIVYNQFIYNSIVNFINFIYKLKRKKGSLLIDFNYNLNLTLQRKIKKNGLKYLDEISFYPPTKIDRNLLFKKYNKKYNKNFLKKYIHVRENDNKGQTAIKHIYLLKKYGYLNLKNKISIKYKKNLLKKLQINQKYVCFYIRPHDNPEEYRNSKNEIDPRATDSISIYLKFIKDCLLKKGYQVVLMGSFHKAFEDYIYKENIINYRNSKYQNIYNDFILTQNSIFSISDPGGFTIIPSILNKPNLMINSSCFYDNYYWDKTIYLPKNFIKSKKIMKYKEILKSSVFFENGTDAFILNKITTSDVKYIKLLKAFKYFERMVIKDNFTLNHSRHKIIKKNLTKLHLLANIAYKKYSKAYLESSSFN
jgi:putative glycosyltransferase (TIGR04372 family)